MSADSKSSSPISFFKSSGATFGTPERGIAARRILKPRPILCCLDPLERDDAGVLTLIESARPFACGSEIRPVSVVSQVELNWPLEYMAPLQAKLDRVEEKTLKPMLKGLSKKLTLSPRVLMQKGSSRRQTAEAILAYAEREKAKMIAVKTHGRRGFERFRLGSFAEILLTMSKIPVLAINPKAEVPAQLKRVLFPTDFSVASRRALRASLPWIKESQARVTLFHMSQFPIQYYSSYGEWQLGLDPRMAEQIQKDEENRARRRGLRMRRHLELQGIPCDFVQYRANADLAHAITGACKKESADVILLASTASRWARAILGSVARDVVVTAPRPVLVVHS